MTEPDWLACSEPAKMLAFLQGKASERKLRLFACACCRHIWPMLTHECSRNAVLAAERFADNLVSRTKLTAARNDIKTEIRTALRAKVYQTAWDETGDEGMAEARALTWASAWDSAKAATRSKAMDAAEQAAEAAAITAVLRRTASQRHAALLREIFGNPFRSITVDPVWLKWNRGRIAKIAVGIYDHRDLTLLPSLSAALAEAGCHDKEIIDHCRAPAEHVRGCWVIDALLGKG